MENEIKKILEIEKEARRILNDSQNESDTVKASADKESRKIIESANKEAQEIIIGYKTDLEKIRKKDRKKSEEENVSLKENWIKRYEAIREELMMELTDFLLKS